MNRAPGNAKALCEELPLTLVMAGKRGQLQGDEDTATLMDLWRRARRETIGQPPGALTTLLQRNSILGFSMARFCAAQRSTGQHSVRSRHAQGKRPWGSP